MKMGSARNRNRAFKVKSEFGTVIGLDRRRTIRQHSQGFSEKIRRTCRSMIRVAGGKSCSPFCIHPGKNVSFHAVNETHHGINLQDPVSLGSAELLFSLQYAFGEPSGASIKRQLR